jgi:hypothetical protein
MEEGFHSEEPQMPPDDLEDQSHKPKFRRTLLIAMAITTAIVLVSLFYFLKGSDKTIEASPTSSLYEKGGNLINAGGGSSIPANGSPIKPTSSQTTGGVFAPLVWRLTASPRQILLVIVAIAVLIATAVSLWYLAKISGVFTSTSGMLDVQPEEVIESVKVESVMTKFMKLKFATKFILMIVAILLLCVVKTLMSGLSAYMIYRSIGKSINVETMTLDLKGDPLTLGLKVNIDSFFMLSLYVEPQDFKVKLVKRGEVEHLIATVTIPTKAIGGNFRSIDYSDDSKVSVEIKEGLNLAEFYQELKIQTAYFTELDKMNIPFKVITTGRIFTISLGIPLWYNVNHEYSLELSTPQPPEQAPPAEPMPTDSPIFGFDDAFVDSTHNDDDDLKWKFKLNGFINISNIPFLSKSNIRVPLKILAPRISLQIYNRKSFLSELFVEFIEKNNDKANFCIGIGTIADSHQGLIPLAKAINDKNYENINLELKGKIDEKSALYKIINTLTIEGIVKDFMENSPNRPQQVQAQEAKVALRKEEKPKGDSATFSIHEIKCFDEQQDPDTKMPDRTCKGLKMNATFELNQDVIEKYPLIPRVKGCNIDPITLNVVGEREEEKGTEKTLAVVSIIPSVTDKRISVEFTLAIHDLLEISQIAYLYYIRMALNYDWPEGTKKYTKIVIKGKSDNSFLMNLYEGLEITLHLSGEGAGSITLGTPFKKESFLRTYSAMDRSSMIHSGSILQIPQRQPVVKPITLQKSLAEIDHQLKVLVLNGLEKFEAEMQVRFFEKDRFAGPNIKIEWRNLSLGIGHSKRRIFGFKLDEGSVRLTLASGLNLLKSLHSGSINASISIPYFARPSDLIQTIFELNDSYSKGKKFVPLDLIVGDDLVPFVIPSQEMMPPSSSPTAATGAESFVTMVPISSDLLMPLFAYGSSTTAGPVKVPQVSCSIDFEMSIQDLVAEASLCFETDLRPTDPLTVSATSKEQSKMALAQIRPVAIKGSWVNDKLQSWDYVGKDVEDINNGMKKACSAFQSGESEKTFYGLPILLSLSDSDTLSEAITRFSNFSGFSIALEDDNQREIYLGSILNSIGSSPKSPEPAAPTEISKPSVKSESGAVSVEVSNGKNSELITSFKITLPSLADINGFSKPLVIYLPETRITLGSASSDYVELHIQSLRIPYRLSNLPIDGKLYTNEISMAIKFTPSTEVKNARDIRNAVKLLLSDPKEFGLSSVKLDSYIGSNHVPFNYEVKAEVVQKLVIFLKEMLMGKKTEEMKPTSELLQEKKGNLKMKPVGAPSPPMIVVDSIGPIPSKEIPGEANILPCPLVNICQAKEWPEGKLSPTARVYLGINGVSDTMYDTLPAIYTMMLKVLNWPTSTEKIELNINVRNPLKAILSIDDFFDAGAVSIPKRVWKWDFSLSGDTALAPSSPPEITIQPTIDRKLLFPLDIYCNPGTPNFRKMLSVFKLYPMPFQFPRSHSFITQDLRVTSQAYNPMLLSVEGDNFLFSIVSGLVDDIHITNSSSAPPQQKEVTAASGEGLPTAKKATEQAIKLVVEPGWKKIGSLKFLVEGLGKMSIPETFRLLKKVRIGISYRNETVFEMLINLESNGQLQVLEPQVILSNGTELGEMIGAILAGKEVSATLSVKFGDSDIISTKLQLPKGTSMLSQIMLDFYERLVLTSLPQGSVGKSSDVSPDDESEMLDPAIYMKFSLEWGAVSVATGLASSLVRWGSAPFTCNLEFGLRQHYLPQFLSFAIDVHKMAASAIPSTLRYYDPSRKGDVISAEIKSFSGNAVPILFNARPSEQDKKKAKANYDPVASISNLLNFIENFYTVDDYLKDFLKKCTKGDGADRSNKLLTLHLHNIYSIFNILFLISREGETCLTFPNGSLDISLGENNLKPNFHIPINLEGLQYPLQYNYFADPCRARVLCGYDNPASPNNIDPRSNWQYSFKLTKQDLGPSSPFQVKFLGGSGSISVEFIPTQYPTSNSIKVKRGNEDLVIGRYPISRPNGVFPPNAMEVGVKMVYKAFERRLYIECWDTARESQEPIPTLRTVFPMDFATEFKYSKYKIKSNAKPEFYQATPELLRTRVYFDSMTQSTLGAKNVRFILELRDSCDSQVALSDEHTVLGCRLQSADKKHHVIGKVMYSVESGLYLFQYDATVPGTFKIQLSLSKDKWEETLDYPKVFIY